MSTQTINCLLSTFGGHVAIPSILSFQFNAQEPVQSIIAATSCRLPKIENRYVITTLSNRDISTRSTHPISSLLKEPEDTFIPLRLTVPVYGGKGGFGSQLRAAGGRMSSKRKKKQGENNGSSRNLDGRRLRTVTEAKALAEYLAIKPEMERKDKDVRRKRWEKVIDLAEKRDEEMKNLSKGKVDGRWVEEKEDASERTREAVIVAMASGSYAEREFRIIQESSLASPERKEDGASFQCNAQIKQYSETLLPSFRGFEDDDISEDSSSSSGG